LKSCLSLQSKAVEKPSAASKPASKPVSKTKPDPNQSMPKITKKVIEDPKKKKPKDEVMERYDEKLAVMSRESFFVIKRVLMSQVQSGRFIADELGRSVYYLPR